MKFIVEQNRNRMIYTDWQNVPEDLTKIFSLALFLRSSEIVTEQATYKIDFSEESVLS